MTEPQSVLKYLHKEITIHDCEIAFVEGDSGHYDTAILYIDEYDAQRDIFICDLSSADANDGQRVVVPRTALDNINWSEWNNDYNGDI